MPHQSELTSLAEISPNDGSVVALVGQRERGKTLQLLRQRFPSLSREDHEDCFQQAWEKAFCRRFELSNEIAGFLRVVAFRRALDLCKRRDRSDLSLDQEIHAVSNDPVELLGVKQEAAVACDLLAQLKPRARQVAAMRWVAQLSPSEIQAKTGLSKKQYEGLLTRSRRTLRQQMLLAGFTVP